MACKACWSIQRHLGLWQRVRCLPIFVSRRAFLVSPDWLPVGYPNWKTASMAFVRDYFLPFPTVDLAGARHVMAEYPHVVTLTKRLWQSLRLPRWQEGRWDLSAGSPQDFNDGFGLCSPGRWPPSRRSCAADTLSLALPEHVGARLLDLLRCRLDLHTLWWQS